MGDVLWNLEFSWNRANCCRLWKGVNTYNGTKREGFEKNRVRSDRFHSHDWTLLHILTDIFQHNKRILFSVSTFLSRILHTTTKTGKRTALWQLVVCNFQTNELTQTVEGDEKFELDEISYRCIYIVIVLAAGDWAANSSTTLTVVDGWRVTTSTNSKKEIHTGVGGLDKGRDWNEMKLRNKLFLCHLFSALLTSTILSLVSWDFWVFHLQ